LLGEIVWANSLQGGFIFNINRWSHQKGGIPVSRSFILGGVNSLRGFDGLLAGDRVPDKEEFPIKESNQVLDGQFSLFALLRTELRFPLRFLFNSLEGAIFYDGGGVMISEMHFERPYRHSTGFGFRYKTPVGSLSVYIAFKILPKAFESLWLPHISFGTF